MAGASLTRSPLRTQKLWTDALQLERNEFYKPATALYIEFLEHIVLIAALSYYEIHNPLETNSKRNKIFKLKDEKKLTLSNIKKMCPKKLWDAESKRCYKEVTHIRNTVVAHPYFAISFNITPFDDRRLSDVNNHRKLIRRLYKIVKSERRIDGVEAFLHKVPFIDYKDHEQDSLRLEQMLLKEICRKTRENVELIQKLLSRGIALNNPFTHVLDEWIDPPEKSLSA